MGFSRIHIYLLFFLILIVIGCNCKGERKKVNSISNVNAVSKTFTCEINAKYHHNNEPIQSEGKAIVIATIDDYTLVYSGEILSETHHYTSTVRYEKEFNQNGKAVITIDEFEFDTSGDKISIEVSTFFPTTSDVEISANTKFAMAYINSPEIFNFFFTGISLFEL